MTIVSYSPTDALILYRPPNKTNRESAAPAWLSNSRVKPQRGSIKRSRLSYFPFVYEVTKNGQLYRKDQKLTEGIYRLIDYLASIFKGLDRRILIQTVSLAQVIYPREQPQRNVPFRQRIPPYQRAHVKRKSLVEIYRQSRGKSLSASRYRQTEQVKSTASAQYIRRKISYDGFRRRGIESKIRRQSDDTPQPQLVVEEDKAVTETYDDRKEILRRV